MLLQASRAALKHGRVILAPAEGREALAPGEPVRLKGGLRVLRPEKAAHMAETPPPLPPGRRGSLRLPPRRRPPSSSAQLVTGRKEGLIQTETEPRGWNLPEGATRRRAQAHRPLRTGFVVEAHEAFPGPAGCRPAGPPHTRHVHSGLDASSPALGTPSTHSSTPAVGILKL